MRKFLLILIIAGAALWAGGYFFYTFYFPQLVARAIVSESEPVYLPKRILNQLEGIRKPINKSTESLIKEFKKANVPMSEVYESIDNTSEEEVEAMLSELNSSEFKTSDEVFDILKAHVETDFDLEQFRQSFNDHVDPKTVRRILKYANMNRRTQEVDMKTTKEVVKHILKEKEKELQ